MRFNSTPAIAAEIDRVNQLTQSMLDAYVNWGSQYKIGDVEYLVYRDVIDFVNFRMETASSCLSLIQGDKIADTLGLSRVLLENYLLFMLMCRGRKHFRLQDATHMKPQEFAAELKRRQDEWEALKAKGETRIARCKVAPRAARHIMFVDEDLYTDTGEKSRRCPLYFQFEHSDPFTLRLSGRDYSSTHEKSETLTQAEKRHRAEAIFQYRHFLSLRRPVSCLSLNGILDKQAG